VQSLKEEVDDLKKKEQGDEKVMQATAEANKRMSDPMRKAIADVKRLREEREAYRLDVVALQECKAAAMVVSDRIDALRWEHEIMGQRYERLVAERDALARKFREAVHEVQQKAGFKALLLEQKLAVVAEEREKAQLVLGEVLAHANIGGAGGAESTALRKGAEGLAQVSGGAHEGIWGWAAKEAQCTRALSLSLTHSLTCTYTYTHTHTRARALPAA
jgi:hypothetical protein